ncbi:MAG: CheR family methyltransferase [Caulobacteraceae bacterium]|nr:CheR family methyltransferase [Caulobacteraceae bacterium]
MAAVALKEPIPPLQADRISRRNFQRLSEYIYDYCGIKLPPTKMTMVEGRLRRRLRALNLTSFDAYCDFIFEQGGLEQENVYLVNALTTNKTDFFREPKHFEFLSRTALPEIIQRRPRRIKAWSAACSTGAEPYTLAMVIDHALGDGPDIPYSILATDLSTDVLAVARRGVYPEDMLEPTPKALRRKYVLESKDRSAKLCRIAPALRAQVSFARMNLMDPAYPVDKDLDMIFCRNVLIYFDKPTQQAVLDKLCDHLRPGGYLFLGHSESIAGMTLPVTQVANTGFRRR